MPPGMTFRRLRALGRALDHLGLLTRRTDRRERDAVGALATLTGDRGVEALLERQDFLDQGAVEVRDSRDLGRDERRQRHVRDLVLALLLDEPGVRVGVTGVQLGALVLAAGSEEEPQLASTAVPHVQERVARRPR